MLLYGDSGRSSGSRNQRAGYVSYNSMSGSQRRRDRSAERVSRGHDYNNIIFETRGDAEVVLTRMDEILDEYRVVSVADLYDLAGLDCNYTDNDYGWTSIDNAQIIRGRDGFQIKLPKAMPIN